LQLPNTFGKRAPPAAADTAAMQGGFGSTGFTPMGPMQYGQPMGGMGGGYAQPMGGAGMSPMDYSSRLDNIEAELMKHYAHMGVTHIPLQMSQPMMMHPAEHEMQMQRAMSYSQMTPMGYHAPMMAPAPAPLHPADHMNLMAAYNELAKSHTHLLMQHSDLITSQVAQGSPAVAAARLKAANSAAAAPAAPAGPSTDPNVPTSNHHVGEAPVDPNLMDNTLLFLPERAVVELGIAPNMDDKGDDHKELWFGRVWELRSLLAAKYKHKLAAMGNTEAPDLTTTERAMLEQKFNNPEHKAKLIKMQARWKAAALRSKQSLRLLERLKFCNLRGTLVYAHGSGGCSWDNMRICRMIARLGCLVVAPDGFAYPKNTAMGELRHKDTLPLHKEGDNIDYWEGDLIYCSDATGSSNYSTKAESVLESPTKYCDLYERCYQLRRSELHFTIRNLPQFIKTRGFFLGGTSEGGMTIARFDDQRYGEQVCGRFINSFSCEYNYFCPTPQAGELGGQTDVPTLNIIGTKDQYFGPEDSVAKIVALDKKSGYGNRNMVGHGYNTFVKQGVESGLVVLLEDGVHSPCNTHDNFLRQLFDIFFARPGSIWELDAIWDSDPSMKDVLQVRQSSVAKAVHANVVQCFVPLSKFPNSWSLRQVDAMSMLSNAKADKLMAEQMAKEAKELAVEHKKAATMLDGIRKQSAAAGGIKVERKANSVYDNDKLASTNLLAKKQTVNR